MPGLLTPTSFIGLDIGVYPHTTEDGPKHQTVTAPIGAVCLVASVPEIAVAKEE